MNVREAVGYFFLVPAGIGLSLGFVGAFETAERLAGYDIVAYWLPGVWVAWLLVYAANRSAVRLLRPWNPPLFVSLVAGCGLAAVAISFEFFWYESAYFPELLAEIGNQAPAGTAAVPDWRSVLAVYYPMVLPTVLLIALPINYHFFRQRPSRHAGTPDAAAVAAPQVPRRAEEDAPDAPSSTEEAPENGTPGAGSDRSPFFARLPGSLGTDILCIEAQQHYLKVTTTLGSALVLYRLSDAVEELRAADGLRVHRSYWVGRLAVERVERDNGRLWLRLVTGLRVPVSRTYRLAAKDAGWH